LADTPGIISSKIVIDTTQVTQATRQVQDFKEAVATAKKSDDKSTLFYGELKSLKELQEGLKQAQAELKNYKALQNSISQAKERTAVASENQRLKDQATAIRDNSKALQEQAKVVQSWETARNKAYADRAKGAYDANFVAQMKEQYANVGLISSAKERTNVAAQDQYYKDQLRGSQGFSAQLKEQMTPQSYINLQTQIRKAADEAERLYVAQKKSGTSGDITAYNRAQADLRRLVATQNEYTNSIARSTTMLDGFGRRIKSHLEWLSSGLLLAGIFSIPMQSFEAIKKVDQAMAGMQQVSKDLHGNQQAINVEAQKFIDIAATYGESVENIVKAGTSWGRMYKDLNIVNALTHQSAIVAVADNMSLIDANRGVEAAMFQYGMVAKDTTEAMAYSGKVIDVVTKLAHTAGTTAQDLFAAISRTGSVARLAGVDFEFLNAMIATTTRGTQLSGENIGNMFKSVLGSIHSKKATDEIEALGVATKKVGKDGTVELRKAQDVLLDIAVLAQGSEKNLEDLFKAVSGGKFQWAKTAAMLGDYKTFIATWGEAVNSTGFAADQVQIQIDTIARRIQRLTADLQGLAVDGGNNGLTKYWKEQLAGVDNLVMGLKSVPKAVTDTVVTLTVLSITAGLLAKVYNSVAIAATEAAVATTAFGRASAFLSKTNIIMALLGVAATVIGTYAESIGKANNADRDAIQTKQDAIAVQEQQMEQMKKQGEFVDAMFSSREKLLLQSQDESKSAEKKILINQDITATEQELTKVLGEAAMERIRQSGWSVEQIEIEKNTFTKAQDTKKISLNDMKNAMKTDLDNKIYWLQNCIAAYYDEVDAFKDSISKKIALLGVWKAAMLTMQEWNTAGLERGQESTQARLDKYIADGGSDPSVIATYQRNIAELASKAEESRDAGKAIVNEPLDRYKADLAKAEGERKGITAGNVNFKEIGAGGDNYEPSGNPKKVKDTTNGGVLPSDPSRKIERDAYKDDVTLALHKAKLATDAYADSIDTLNTNEKIEGKTAETVVQRLSLMQNRRQELNNQEWYSNFMAEKLGKELDEKIGNSEELLREFGVPSKADWDAMNKVTKAGLKIQRRDVMDAHADIKAETAAFYAWEEDASKARKEKTKISNDIRELSSPFKEEELEKARLDRNKVTEDILLANSTNKFDPNNDITLNAIRLHARQEDDKVYADIQKRLDKEVKDYETALDNEKDAEKRASIQRNLTLAQDAANKQRAITANNANAIKQLEYDKNSKIKDGLYGITQEVLIQGNSLKSVWNNLWQGLANDALKALFKIQNSTPGLLSSILGLFGVSGGTTNTSVANLTNSASNASQYFPSTAFADGGLVNRPTNALIGETDEEETIINLAKLAKGDKRQQGLLGYANSKISKGTQVTANVSEKTMSIASQASATQQLASINAEHLSKLDEQNALMRTQNQMLMTMIQKGSNQGGITALQPITMAQSDDDLYAQITRMKRNNYNI